jgi:hypothetical protein
MVTGSKSNRDNFINIRHKVSRYCRNKKGEYQKDKFMGLQRTVRTRTLETYMEK